MWRAHRWKRLVVVGSVAIAALVVFGAICSRNAADPGNTRLNAIRNDPALALVPPGGTLEREFSKEARRAPLSKTYLGPTVSRMYQISGDIAEARRFYTERLPSLGWEFWKSVPLSTADDLLFTKNFGSWEAKLTVHITDGEQELTVLIDAPPAKTTAD